MSNEQRNRESNELIFWVEAGGQHSRLQEASHLTVIFQMIFLGTVKFRRN
jgi:hypothetical protein